jgi:hypothetical protein
MNVVQRGSGRRFGLHLWICFLLTLLNGAGSVFAQQTPLIPITVFDIYTMKDVTGYIDTTGTVVIEPAFQFGAKFYEGLATVKQDGKFGFIDTTGRIVIKPIYDNAWAFSDGLARVVLNKKIGFIDKTGAMKIQPAVDEAGGFSEGLAAVKIEGKYGFIDATGKVVIRPTYSLVRPFSEGLAPVQIPDGGAWGLWGFVDKSGTMTIKPQFLGLTAKDITGFKDGLAMVEKDDADNVTYWYVINKKGEVVLETKIKYTENNPLGNFSEGVAVFGRAKSIERSMAPGYIDRNGNITRPILKIKDQLTGAPTSIPSVIGDFHEGRAYVKVDDKWGFMYPNGNFAFKPLFEDVLDYGYYAKGIITFKLDGAWCHRNATRVIFDGRNAKWDSKEHKIVR